jgi:hypothetical protein
MRKVFYKTDQTHPQIQAYKQAVEKGMNSQHVLPRGNAWIVKRAGSLKATQVFNTQKEAVSVATTIAQNQGTALFVHGKDGRVRIRQDF